MTAPTSSITSQINGSVGEITLSNPQKHNALDQNAWLSIPLAVAELIESGARVIILSGAGNSFCAGADISEFDVVRKNAETALIYEQANETAFAAIRDAKVPTIAKIRGFCLGGGFGLAAAADLRLADSSATFSVPAAKLGLGYPVDGMADIVSAIGSQGAKQMLFTAERFSSNQMLTMGFLAEILATDALDDHVTELAEQIGRLAPLTHFSTKASIAAALGGSRDAAIDKGNATFSSKDYAEGLLAFKEKRSPKFIGN